MIGFANYWPALLFLAVLGVYFYLKYYKKFPAVQVSSVRLFNGGFARKKRRISLPEWLFLLSLVLIVAALMRPRFGDEQTLVRAKGIDMILAIDISGSMEAIDVPSSIRTDEALLEQLKSGKLKNRLETAKQEVAKFIEERPNDRIGLIVFGEMAYNVAPPTLDHAWLLQQVKRLEPIEMISQRTGIASPLGSGITRLKDSDAQRRVLVLFTDGRNNVEDRLTPLETAQLGKDHNVVIHTVGVGSPNAIVRHPQFGYQPYRDDFDEALLKSIAKSADGTYFHAGDAAGMAKVMREINELEKTTVEQPKYIEYKEYAPTLAACAALLLLAGLILESTRYLRLP